MTRIGRMSADLKFSICVVSRQQMTRIGSCRRWNERKSTYFSEECNCGIVRMPGRRFPGCVVQGDDLASLLVAAERVHDLARNTEMRS
jgi:hypothetical protein